MNLRSVTAVRCQIRDCLGTGPGVLINPPRLVWSQSSPAYWCMSPRPLLGVRTNSQHGRKSGHCGRSSRLAGCNKLRSAKHEFWFWFLAGLSWVIHKPVESDCQLSVFIHIASLDTLYTYTCSATTQILVLSIHVHLRTYVHRQSRRACRACCGPEGR